MDVMRSQPATVPWQPTDQDGEPVSLADDAAVAATVTRADGAVIENVSVTVADGWASFDLDPEDTAELDRLDVVWKISDVVRGYSTVWVVGAPYVSLTRLRAEDTNFAAVPDPKLRAKRDAAVSWFERRMFRSFVPRFDTYTVDEATTIVNLERRDVRRVRWVHDADGTPWDADDVAEIVVLGPARWGLKGCFPAGTVIGYEHGADAPPGEVVDALMTATRLALASNRLRVDDAGFPIEGFDPQLQPLYGALKRWAWDPPRVA